MMKITDVLVSTLYEPCIACFVNSMICFSYKFYHALEENSATNLRGRERSISQLCKYTNKNGNLTSNRMKL